ncbi:hypothetical protein ACLOJK_035490 [Asimina triloba]
MYTFHFLRRRTLFHFNNIKSAAAPAAPTIQSLQNPFLVRECHYSQTTQQPSSLIQYLQASLGFSPEGALKVSKQLKQKIKNPDLIPTFLKSHGFSTTQIKSIIDRRPCLLYYAFPESTLAPKIQFFKENGFSDSDVMVLMVKNPHLFSRSLERSIKPFFDLTHSILGRHEFVVELLNRKWLIFNLDSWAANITILRSCGVNDHRISKMIRKHPGFFDVKPDRFNEVVEMVKQMGFRPLLASFMEAVHTIVCLTHFSWDLKFKVYRSVGWSDEEILSAFRKQPVCMSLSEKNIRRSMDYFTKEIGWDLSYIAMHPILLCFSLEKRIIPRYRFLQVLGSKGCIKKDEIFLKDWKFQAEEDLVEQCIMKICSSACSYESQISSMRLGR